MLAGVWVAISPWFLMLQAPTAGNAAAANLIGGLAVAALGLFAICGARGFMGLQAANSLLGIWLILTPFILAAKFTIAAPMYWSNIWAGAVTQCCPSPRGAAASDADCSLPSPARLEGSPL